ncbi:MAG: HAMP domain-containing histidine kinase [Synergistaceae bacterium]|nr:HAMP domain-containing histidine kinase [Synergistaceae bacterium]
MKLTIKSKLVASYVAVSAFLAISLFAVSAHYLDKQFQIYVSHKQDMKNMEIVDAISANFADGRGKPDAKFPIFADEFGHSMLEQGIVIMVNDALGNLIYCPSAEAQECGHMAISSSASDEVCPQFDGAYAKESFPIERGGAIVGSVTLGYHHPFYYSESDRSFLSAYNRAFAGMSVLFFAIAVTIGLLMAGMIVGPIITMTKRTREIEDGNYYGDAIITGTKEIDELSSSVAHLAESLRTQFMLKKRMADAYSHEFRTPLSVLQSNLEAMIDGIWEPGRERLESLLAETLRISRMVSDIDILVQAGSAESPIEKESADIAAMAERILKGFEASAAEKGVELSFEGGKCEAGVDPDKFSQVIVNLISNAVKYTNPGGRVKVVAGEDENNAVLSVEDNGIGIDARDMPYIFEHLYRTDESRARDSGGNGIGLSVAKAIVENHGGRIEVKSRPKEGSVFTVKAPLGGLKT